MGLAEAISRALAKEEQEIAETRWSDALSMSRGVRTWGGAKFRNRVFDTRIATVSVAPKQAFAPIRRIGG